MGGGGSPPTEKCGLAPGRLRGRGCKGGVRGQLASGRTGSSHGQENGAEAGLFTLAACSCAPHPAPSVGATENGTSKSSDECSSQQHTH